MSATSGNVGPIVSSDGTIRPIRLSKDTSVVTQDAHGRYQEAVYRGNVYIAANNAGVAWPIALSATATGMILSNPPQSRVNLSVLEITVVPTVFVAGQLSPLLIAYTGSFTPVVHTTPITITNALLGSTNRSAA